MDPITGFGGVFIYSNDAAALAKWYSEHFDLKFEEYSPGKTYGLTFFALDAEDGETRVGTVFSIFTAEEPLGDSRREFRMNFRIKSATDLRERLENAGIVCEPTEDYDYGKFFWANDPDGNRLEFWEPGDLTGF